MTFNSTDPLRALFARPCFPTLECRNHLRDLGDVELCHFSGLPPHPPLSPVQFVSTVFPVCQQSSSLVFELEVIPVWTVE